VIPFQAACVPACKKFCGRVIFLRLLLNVLFFPEKHIHFERYANNVPHFFPSVKMYACIFPEKSIHDFMRIRIQFQFFLCDKILFNLHGYLNYTFCREKRSDRRVVVGGFKRSIRTKQPTYFHFHIFFEMDACTLRYVYYVPISHNTNNLVINVLDIILCYAIPPCKMVKCISFQWFGILYTLLALFHGIPWQRKFLFLERAAVFILQDIFIIINTHSLKSVKKLMEMLRMMMMRLLLLWKIVLITCVSKPMNVYCSCLHLIFCVFKYSSFCCHRDPFQWYLVVVMHIYLSTICIVLCMYVYIIG